MNKLFLKTVLADGTAEQAVIREMKARAAGARGDIEQIVRGVMADVQERGWDAVVEYAEKFDGKAPYIVEQSVLDEAYNACDPKLIAALEKAAANIRDYHEQMLVKTWEWKRSAGEILGQTVRGLARVGIYVPGGTAAYPSSVLMNAIPAKVAGVGELIMVTPPTENMSNEVLAAAKIAGVDTVIAIGGTQAIAALTYGAGFIPQVDKIVGPGNAFVAAAKKLAFGTVDIDMIAGPSEVLVIADHTANPTYVAADLLSQAEHDKLASAVLLTDSMAQAQAISCEMERQAKLLPRWEIIRESVANYGCAIVFDDLKDACKMADVVAPEHLEVAAAVPAQRRRDFPRPVRPGAARRLHGRPLPRSADLGHGAVLLSTLDRHVSEENQRHRVHERCTGKLCAGYYRPRAERTPGRARKLDCRAFCGGKRR